MNADVWQIEWILILVPVVDQITGSLRLRTFCQSDLLHGEKQPMSGVGTPSIISSQPVAVAETSSRGALPIRMVSARESCMVRTEGVLSR